MRPLISSTASFKASPIDAGSLLRMDSKSPRESFHRKRRHLHVSACVKAWISTSSSEPERNKSTSVARSARSAIESDLTSITSKSNSPKIHFKEVSTTSLPWKSKTLPPPRRRDDCKFDVLQAIYLMSMPSAAPTISTANSSAASGGSASDAWWTVMQFDIPWDDTNPTTSLFATIQEFPRRSCRQEIFDRQMCVC